MAKKLIKKKSGGEPVKDSTSYYKNVAKTMALKSAEADKKGNVLGSKMYEDTMIKANDSAQRQKNKGKAGFDANGFPKKKIGGTVKIKTKK